MLLNLTWKNGRRSDDKPGGSTGWVDKAVRLSAMFSLARVSHIWRLSCIVCWQVSNLRHIPDRSSVASSLDVLVSVARSSIPISSLSRMVAIIFQHQPTPLTYLQQVSQQYMLFWSTAIEDGGLPTFSRQRWPSTKSGKALVTLLAGPQPT